MTVRPAHAIGESQAKSGTTDHEGMSFWELTFSRLPIWQTGISEWSLWGERSGRFLPGHRG